MIEFSSAVSVVNIKRTKCIPTTERVISFVNNNWHQMERKMDTKVPVTCLVHHLMHPVLLVLVLHVKMELFSFVAVYYSNAA